MEQQLTVIKDRKPAPTQTAEMLKRREQADKVLAKHKGDLPQEIVAMLNSHLDSIVKMGLREAAEWITNRNAQLKDEYCRAHPSYQKVRRLVNSAEGLLSGPYGKVIEAKISPRNLRMLQTDLYTVLKTNMVERMELAVKQAWLINKAEHRDDPNATEPEPPTPKAKSKTKSRKPKPEGPIRHEIIVEGEQTRERRPKVRKAYAGLPPVQTGEVDWSQGELPSSQLGNKPNPQGLDADQKRRGRPVPDAGKTSRQLAAKRGPKG